MTMMIQSSQTFGGVPALRIRQLLKSSLVSRESKQLGVKVLNAAFLISRGLSAEVSLAILEDLLKAKYILVIDRENRFGLDPIQRHYMINTLGHSFLQGTAARRIRRATADRLLKEFMGRVREINHSARFLEKVTTVIVFGSYLRDTETLGDLDLAVDGHPKILDPKKYLGACMKHFEESGKPPGKISNLLDRPEKQAKLYLKNHQRSLRLQVLNDFISMPKNADFSYKVLLGDAGMIALRLASAQGEARWPRTGQRRSGSSEKIRRGDDLS